MDAVDFGTDVPVGGNLDVRWIHGAARPRRGAEPPLQVHRHDPHTYVLRQSKLVSHEAPFVYLMFGNAKALLLDTGATKDHTLWPLRKTVDGLISEWLAENPRTHYTLVVAHTHGHRDHVAGDDQFADRPDTTIVGRAAGEMFAHFGLTDDQPVPYDLGGRILEVMATPGHHPAAVTIFDPWTGWLLTGDTVYPGRLYAFDFPAFQNSLERILKLAEARAVTQVMGCHIEMTRSPRRDYPIGARYQPNEAGLPMTVDQLRAVCQATREVAARPGAHTFDDFVIFNGPCTGAVLRQLIRAVGRQVRGALAPWSLH